MWTRIACFLFPIRHNRNRKIKRTYWIWQQGIAILLLGNHQEMPSTLLKRCYNKLLCYAVLCYSMYNVELNQDLKSFSARPLMLSPSLVPSYGTQVAVSSHSPLSPRSSDSSQRVPSNGSFNSSASSNLCQRNLSNQVQGSAESLVGKVDYTRQHTC